MSVFQLLFLGLFASTAWAEIPSNVLHSIRHLAIQHNGRLKPFDSFARETLELIIGSSRIGRQDPVATVLAIAASPSEWVEAKLIAMPFVPLREQLGFDRTTTHVSFNELVATRKLMRMLPSIVEKRQRDEPLTIFESETMDVYSRFVALNSLFQQEFHVVPSPHAINREWLPILQTPLAQQWTACVSAFQAGNAEQIQQSLQRLTEAIRQVNPGAYPGFWRLRLEVLYNYVAPFSLVRVIYLAATLAFLVSLLTPRRKASALAIGALVAGFVVHGAGIVARVILGGRPPVSNFYETMLWLPFVVVGLALLFEWLYRVSFFGLAASALAAITLWIAGLLPLDPSISPVVAVLRSNLWLTVHVLTIVASYGALTLAVGLAHIYGWLYLIRSANHPALSALGTSLYRTIQVGVVLLAGGIMLGAIWANASWGRYWGWDPKETWALITLLWFVAILHGRLSGWLKGIGVALATIGGFFLLLMTYYGVSFYLVGLHSYAGGHAKPLPSLLIAYLMGELAFMAAVGLAALRRRKLA